LKTPISLACIWSNAASDYSGEILILSLDGKLVLVGGESRYHLLAKDSPVEIEI
jgi:hypothetical protein